MSQDKGVRAGFRASHEAADASSPKASIPDAFWVYKSYDFTLRVRLQILWYAAFNPRVLCQGIVLHGYARAVRQHSPNTNQDTPNNE